VIADSSTGDSRDYSPSLESLSRPSRGYHYAGVARLNRSEGPSSITFAQIEPISGVSVRSSHVESALALPAPPPAPSRNSRQHREPEPESSAMKYVLGTWLTEVLTSAC